MNKITFQRGDNKIEIESGLEDGSPNWTSMKDGAGGMITTFTNSFISALIPTFIIFLILGIIVYNWLC